MLVQYGIPLSINELSAFKGYGTSFEKIALHPHLRYYSRARWSYDDDRCINNITYAFDGSTSTSYQAMDENIPYQSYAIELDFDDADGDDFSQINSLQLVNSNRNTPTFTRFTTGGAGIPQASIVLVVDCYSVILAYSNGNFNPNGRSTCQLPSRNNYTGRFVDLIILDSKYLVPAETWIFDTNAGRLIKYSSTYTRWEHTTVEDFIKYQLHLNGDDVVNVDNSFDFPIVFQKIRSTPISWASSLAYYTDGYLSIKTAHKSFSLLDLQLFCDGSSVPLTVDPGNDVFVPNSLDTGNSKENMFDSPLSRTIYSTARNSPNSFVIVKFGTANVTAVSMTFPDSMTTSTIWAALSITLKVNGITKRLFLPFTYYQNLTTYSYSFSNGTFVQTPSLFVPICANRSALGVTTKYCLVSDYVYHDASGTGNVYSAISRRINAYTFDNYAWNGFPGTLVRPVVPAEIFAAFSTTSTIAKNRTTSPYILICGGVPLYLQFELTIDGNVASPTYVRSHNIGHSASTNLELQRQFVALKSFGVQTTTRSIKLSITCSLDYTSENCYFPYHVIISLGTTSTNLAKSATYISIHPPSLYLNFDLGSSARFSISRTSFMEQDLINCAPPNVVGMTATTKCAFLPNRSYFSVKNTEVGAIYNCASDKCKSIRPHQYLSLPATKLILVSNLVSLPGKSVDFSLMGDKCYILLMASRETNMQVLRFKYQVDGVFHFPNNSELISSPSINREFQVRDELYINWVSIFTQNQFIGCEVKCSASISSIRVEKWDPAASTVYAKLSQPGPVLFGVSTAGTLRADDDILLSSITRSFRKFTGYTLRRMETQSGVIPSLCESACVLASDCLGYTVNSNTCGLIRDLTTSPLKTTGYDTYLKRTTSRTYTQNSNRIYSSALLVNFIGSIDDCSGYCDVIPNCVGFHATLEGGIYTCALSSSSLADGTIAGTSVYSAN